MEPNKKHVIIVGAGLGGCFLANSLAENFDVTIVELGSAKPLLQDRVKDIANPAVTYPHICSGLGGTTNLWHNGLIEIDREVFENRWPYPKTELRAYYEKAFYALAGQSRDVIGRSAKALFDKYQGIGFLKNMFGEFLYYPKKRVNPWGTFKLEKRVNLVDGEVVDFEIDSKGNIRSVVVKENNKGMDIIVSGDIFVLAAGGLSTPLLLHKLASKPNGCAHENIGFNYEDHPSAVFGEIVLSVPLYKLWNYPCFGGSLRLPLVVQQDGLQVSFQLRPSAQFLNRNGRSHVKSVLSDLRNNLLSLKLYWRLLTNYDDIFEIISMKIGLNFPTRYYHLLMVAEQGPSMSCAVWSDTDSSTFYRKWLIDDKHITTYEAAFRKLVSQLSDKVTTARTFSDWQENVFSSSHHSGTARMALTPKDGVCDKNALVFGFNNLFISDGSAIPATGTANTGLTIAALAIKLGDHIREKFL
ncbi:GMC oxidoreductase [Pseudomonadales bacterium]|nr:GMC oxidoreductase [Pseudomonadales bacterium]